jgi:hypothetical protein
MPTLATFDRFAPQVSQAYIFWYAKAETQQPTAKVKQANNATIFF